LSQTRFERSGFPELSEKSVEKWAKIEGHNAAADKVHRDGNLEGGHIEAESEVLPKDYASESKPFAEKRITLSGYPLADLLKDLAP
jgi:hypothetical protein